jgi:UDP-3-O-[3-hydroxymyristoyl] glucosamine N-acyltransferase LpxD
MGYEIEIRPKKCLKVSDISTFLGVEYFGDDIQINTLRSLDNAVENSLVFSKRNVELSFLKEKKQVCYLLPTLPEFLVNNTAIVVNNPRLTFAKVLSEFFVQDEGCSIGKNTIIHPTARISDCVTIGNCCSVGKHVEIGDYSKIGNNVVLSDGVKIGRYCFIKSNTVIGEKGFGFDFEEDGTPVAMPHLYSVHIKDHVEIGALNTIVAGVLEHTVIHADVKTDDHVHIAHNCIIGAKTIITACSEISGSVQIGERCWLGPNCSLMNKITIEDCCLIGLGAVVRKNVSAGSVMAGNPAKIIKTKKPAGIG